MKIERINDMQIRCTLTREDLEEREIKLGELAYGSEKARELFRDMMDRAANEVGFEADDIPLMIEAVPLSQDSIVLIISKVDSPEELDTRFSSFTENPEDEPMDAAPERPVSDEEEDLFALISQIRSRQETVPKKEKTAAPRVRLFRFADLDSAISLAHSLRSFYFGPSTLYRDAKKGIYFLALGQGSMSDGDFNRVSHMASAFLTAEKYTPGGAAFLKEHMKVILNGDAIERLSQV